MKNINEQLNNELNSDVNSDILTFINSKKSNIKLNNNIIFDYYTQILSSFSIKILNKFINIDNKNNIIKNGLDIIYNLYFILILYTNNIKVTIFLLERSFTII